MEGEDLQALLNTLAGINEEQFRRQVLEKQVGPGVIAEIARRTAELLQSPVRPHPSVHLSQPAGPGVSTADAQLSADQSTSPGNFPWQGGFFRVLCDVAIVTAVQNGIHFLVWTSAYLRKKNQINMLLRSNFQFVDSSFVLDNMLPRAEFERRWTHYVVLADTPIVPNHFAVVPKKYLLSVTDSRIADCVKIRERLAVFYGESAGAPRSRRPLG